MGRERALFDLVVDKGVSLKNGSLFECSCINSSDQKGRLQASNYIGIDWHMSASLVGFLYLKSPFVPDYSYMI